MFKIRVPVQQAKPHPKTFQTFLSQSLSHGVSYAKSRFLLATSALKRAALRLPFRIVVKIENKVG